MLNQYTVPHVTHQEQLIFPNQPFHDGFLDTMRKVFFASRFFGVAGSKKGLWRLWGVLMLILLTAIKAGAVYKLIKLLLGMTVYSVGNRSVTARLAGTLFYAASFFSLLLSWRVSSKWEKISAEWAAVEKKLSKNVASDNGIKRRMITVSVFMACGAFIEHLLSILSNIDQYDTSAGLILQQYILNSHGFIFVLTDYSIWLAVPLFFMSNMATILWGLQDLLIVLISMGLTSRYHRLNECVAKICNLDKNEVKWCKYTESLKVYTWRKMREAYVKQALLVRKVDAVIGSLILLSSSGNFYFICLQLFLGITQGISGAVLKRFYYMLSLAWLCLRFSLVVLAAADVNVHSNKALRFLHSCSDRNYNTEIERLIKQLSKDYIALSGMGFFYIDRGMLLQMASAIITYELVLIQFDGKAGSQLHGALKYSFSQPCLQVLFDFVSERIDKAINFKCFRLIEAFILEIVTDMTVELGVQNIHKEKSDEFLSTLIEVFTLAKFFGIPSYGGKIAFFGAVTMLTMLAVLEFGAVWKLVRLLAGMATNVADGRGFIGRLSGTIFYGNALLSLVLSWRLMATWKRIEIVWRKAETTGGLIFPADKKIRRRVIFVSCSVGVCAVVEHMMSMMSATGFDIPPGEYFHRYILSSHGFLLQADEYSVFLAIPIFILSKLATILWNFQDLIIILISMGLTSRYNRLNLYVGCIVRMEKRAEKRDVKKFGTELYIQEQTWRRVREAYVRQASLVRLVDKQIGWLLLLSNMNNFYFICLQLYLGINKAQGNMINKTYYMYSTAWLLLRACCVVLCAADVNVHSRNALPMLYACPKSTWNIEIKRLKQQLTNDTVALTGLGLFVMQRQLLLQVAAAILKYELVLIQYDN